MSERIRYRVNRCSGCKEVMPRFVLVCYCSSPVKEVEASEEEKEKSKSYHNRAWLYKQRKIDV